MGFQMRDTLRRLCEDIGWNYAVFWRAIGDGSPMHLFWEDGYWDHGTMASEVELLVNKIMASQTHAFGDGIVGKAASQGIHFWILRDMVNAFGLGSKDLAELNHQFLAGMQTIAIIPILPLGVLQLGSSQMANFVARIRTEIDKHTIHFQKVMENIGFVNCVTNFFRHLGCARDILPGIAETALAQTNRTYGGASPITSEPLPDKVAVKIKSMPLNDSVDPMIRSVADEFFNQRDHLRVSQGISTYLYPECSSNSSQSVLTAGKQKKENGLCQDYYVPSTEFDVSGPCSNSVFSTQDSKFKRSNIAQESRIQRPLDADLYDVLGPDYKMDNGGFSNALVHMGDARVDGLVTHISTSKTQFNAYPISYSSIDGTSGPGMFAGADTDQLLDAVISKINIGAKHNSDDNCFCKPSEKEIDGTSLPDVSPSYKLVASSKQLQGEPFGGRVLGISDAAGSSSVISSSSLGNITEECFPNTGVLKSQIKLWTENGQSMKCDNLSGMHSKRADDESNKQNKKRSRPGENARPRPKDRQMIMDRVKELREIIPNGAKLSIDALLEKTIKQMLFLQSVTKHAEKLKDIGERKFIDREQGLHLKENVRSGATWAYEVGTQPMTCPIIVEDLNPPRQMLVEMLCEQRGFFLEIAEYIRGSGFTILKGVMEVRKEKIWARFAVEANRDVTRVEVFLSLVRLLEPTFGSTTSPQGVDKISSLHNVYNRSCIPASGPSDHLQ